MPKVKTHKAAKKRFILTGSGKLKRRSASRSHNFEKKSPRQKRRYTKPQDVSPADKDRAERLLGIK